jgi:toxin ParE1/3/4
MYKLSKLAAEDFAAIYEYTLLKFGARQVDAYTDDLESTFRLLSSSPLMGHECQEIADGVRRHDHQH